ncbi:GIY-YIG nuclease family protein [Apilactobacillus kunkeei]|nr:GIY-YIG nuclease family protein [Apilactobacillus kunkeei]
MEEFQIINIKAESLETAIHHALQNYRLDMDIRLSNGNLVSPREWFNIDIETIENIISEIVAKLQMNQ